MNITHLPSDFWKSPVIKQRLMLEACFDGNRGIPAKKHYWVVVPQSDTRDGTLVLKNFEPTLQDAEPHELQQDFAKGLQKHLQQEIHFDGVWIVGYSHPPTTYGVITDTENCFNRLFMIWLDQDGDPQYTIESELPFVQQVGAGMDYYINLCEDGHTQWKEVYGHSAMKEDMMLTTDQQSKAALEAMKDA